MILLRSDTPRMSIVGVFGQGLIGSAIVQQLRKTRLIVDSQSKLDWTLVSALRLQLQEIEQRLVTALGDSGGMLDLVWSAGKAGFSATDDEASRERDTFSAVIDMAGSVVKQCGNLDASFHLVSSAGGLYEGQQRVDDDSVPIPQRPYGRLKLEQERILIDTPISMQRHIYRPSSVYGWLRGGKRQGLIQTMVYNGLLNHETVIIGNMNTLRDYIWVEDVAQTVTNHIGCRKSSANPAIHILANGCPCSIFQIKHTVQTVLNRPVIVRYSRGATNARDTTFAPRLLKNRREPTDMRLAIERMASEFASNGLVLG